MAGNRRFLDPDDTGAGLQNYFSEWRKHRGMTQAQVEAHFNWPASRLSHLENGHARITDQILTALARLYHCSPADLIERPPSSPRRLRAGAGGAMLGCAAALHRVLTTSRTLRASLEPLANPVILHQLDAQIDDLAEALACLEKLRQPLTLAETLVLSLRGELEVPETDPEIE